MNRVNYRDALQRRWWVLVVTAVVGAAIGAFVPVTAAKSGTTVSWRTTALVGSAPATGPGSNASSSLVGTSQILFYAHKSDVIAAAAALAGVKVPLTRLESTITVTGPKDKGGQPGVVKLSTVARTRAQSAAFTNDFAAQLGNYLGDLAKQSQQGVISVAQQRVTALESRITAAGGAKHSTALDGQLVEAEAQVQALEAATPTNGYNILQPAVVSSASRVTSGSTGIHLSHLAWILVGLVAGLLLGAAIVLLVETLDERLHSAERAAEAFGYRVVVEIPVAPKAGVAGAQGGSATGGNQVTNSPTNPVAEAYRKLRMSVLLEGVSSQGQMPGAVTSGSTADESPSAARRVVLVVSAGSEPSRSSVVDHLAMACSEAGEQAIVVDALGDDAGDAVGKASPKRGDLDALDLELYLEPSPLKNVSLLSLGRLIGNSSQLLTRAPTVLAAARRSADTVIIDAPPLLAFHDGEALSSLADVVLVVGEWGRTTAGQARRVGEVLRRFDAPVLGVVFTGTRSAARDLPKAEEPAARGRRWSDVEASNEPAPAGRT